MAGWSSFSGAQDLPLWLGPSRCHSRACRVEYWLVNVHLNLSQVAPIGPFWTLCLWLQRVLLYFWGDLGTHQAADSERC